MTRAKIYTKTGDNGETSLVEGKRVSKADQRIEVYGTIDELNSIVGLALSFFDKSLFPAEVDFLQKVQNQLFNIGSRVACSDADFKRNLPFVDDQLLKEMEAEIDRLNEVLPELKEFILPGGSQASAFLHLARTVTRRAERELIRTEINKEETEAALILNRLSDYFFILARYYNLQVGQSETTWVK